MRKISPPIFDSCESSLLAPGIRRFKNIQKAVEWSINFTWANSCRNTYCLRLYGSSATRQLKDIVPVAEREPQQLFWFLSEILEYPRPCSAEILAHSRSTSPRAKSLNTLSTDFALSHASQTIANSPFVCTKNSFNSEGFSHTLISPSSPKMRGLFSKYSHSAMAGENFSKAFESHSALAAYDSENAPHTGLHIPA